MGCKDNNIPLFNAKDVTFTCKRADFLTVKTGLLHLKDRTFDVKRGILFFAESTNYTFLIISIPFFMAASFIGISLW